MANQSNQNKGEQNLDLAKSGNKDAQRDQRNQNGGQKQDGQAEHQSDAPNADQKNTATEKQKKDRP